MRVVFFNTSSMKYYKGSSDLDIPENGGSYIAEYGSGAEEDNFRTRKINKGEYCLGYVEPKSQGDTKNTLHIERIADDIGKHDQMAEDVLVIWCAKSNLYDFTVTGWYAHADVYRDAEDYRNTQSYYAKAKKEDCVLLPVLERSKKKWEVPRANQNGSGFGQSLVWYADKDTDKPFVKRITAAIKKYDGDNWIDVDVTNEQGFMESEAETEVLTSCEEYAEGRKTYVRHLQRERNKKVVEQAKEAYQSKNGKLMCQICGFDFEKTYGKRGKDFIEAHHLKPISELKSGSGTKVEDILLLCSNCHRMIHRQKPWLTTDELKKIVKKHKK